MQDNDTDIRQKHLMRGGGEEGGGHGEAGGEGQQRGMRRESRAPTLNAVKPVPT